MLTAVLNTGGGETVFRPRISVEVIGLRTLNEGDYTPRRAISVIATLKSESNEANGWGMLYTWKRGSVGVIHQEFENGEDVIALVFGVDLANAIQSRRNSLMEDWSDLRQRLGLD